MTARSKRQRAKAAGLTLAARVIERVREEVRDARPTRDRYRKLLADLREWIDGQEDALDAAGADE